MIRLLVTLTLVGVLAASGCGRKGEPNTPVPAEEPQEQPTS
jgi:hypothetical protein